MPKPKRPTRNFFSLTHPMGKSCVIKNKVWRGGVKKFCDFFLGRQRAKRRFLPLFFAIFRQNAYKDKLRKANFSTIAQRPSSRNFCCQPERHCSHGKSARGRQSRAPSYQNAVFSLPFRNRCLAGKSEKRLSSTGRATRCIKKSAQSGIDSSGYDFLYMRKSTFSSKNRRKKTIERQINPITDFERSRGWV